VPWVDAEGLLSVTRIVTWGVCISIAEQSLLIWNNVSELYVYTTRVLGCKLFHNLHQAVWVAKTVCPSRLQTTTTKTNYTVPTSNGQSVKNLRETQNMHLHNTTIQLRSLFVEE
jgi:hypothetical protein